MAAREVIHFPFWVQLPSPWLFPPSSPPDPVAESPPLLDRNLRESTNLFKQLAEYPGREWESCRLRP
jgi:hypothetical protein